MQGFFRTKAFQIILFGFWVICSCSSSFEKASQLVQDKNISQGGQMLVSLAKKNNGDALWLLLEISKSQPGGLQVSSKQIQDWEKNAENQGNRRTVENLWDQTGFYDFAKQLLTQAKAGEYGAQIALAETYNSGVHVFKHTGQGVFWLAQAAKGGNVDAELILALVFFLGEVVPQDYPRAKIHFERAARGGKVSAYVGLGRLAAGGLGEKVDLKKAYAYFSVANQKTQGKFAGNEMQAIASKLSASEKAQGLEMAKAIGGKGP